MPSKATILGRLGAAAAGFGIAVAASPYPVDNVFQMGPLAKKLMKSPAGKILVRGSQVGGVVAAADLVYSNRHLPPIWYGKSKQGYHLMMQHEGFQKVDRTTRNPKSRGGRGATTLSQRASKSARPGNRRRRCKHIRFVRLPGKEYKRFDTQRCLRPRNHSGRHRFK